MDTRLFELGVVAGAMTVAVSFATSVLFGVPYLPGLAASALFSLVPGSLESAAVENLGPLAKETAYLTASLALVFVLASVPLVLERSGVLHRGAATTLLAGAFSTYAVLLVLAALFLSLTQVPALPVGPASAAVGAVIPSVIFAVAFAVLSLRPNGRRQALYPAERVKKRFDRKRRLFIASAAGAAMGAAALYYGVGFLFSKQSPVQAGQETSQVLSSQVTPNSDFYRVDIDIFAPTIDSSTWSLKLHGLVSNAVTLDYPTIKSLDSVEEYATLECVSNPVGGDLMGTALWKGVRLKTVMDMAGADPQADYIVFRCHDGYDVGIPLEKAIDGGTILAYEMNGEPLPADHGYPLRAIIPGLYGMMNAKWITDIELVSETYNGYWQRRGWTNLATYQTGSTIITPGNTPLRDRFPIPSSLTDILGSPIPIIGEAFGGDRGISKVEVSTDGGTTWQTASLYDPLSQYTWIFWRLDWNPPRVGTYTLKVRATDGTGQVQIATMTNPYPDGATGYSVVDVKVASV